MLSLPLSRGYQSYFVERGLHPLLACAKAALIVYHGVMTVRMQARTREIHRAIRFLAEPGRSDRAVIRCIKLLRSDYLHFSTTDEAFRLAGFKTHDYDQFLERAAHDQPARERLIELAARVAPQLTMRRGPRISAASAAHEFLLENGIGVREVNLYTWDPEIGDFTDPQTRATRLEFDEPDFDPRPAYRRLMRRKKEASA